MASRQFKPPSECLNHNTTKQVDSCGKVPSTRIVRILNILPCFCVLTYNTSFQYQSIHAMSVIACYNYINTMCPIKVDSNSNDLTVHTSCYCVLDLLCVISSMAKGQICNISVFLLWGLFNQSDIRHIVYTCVKHRI